MRTLARPVRLSACALAGLLALAACSSGEPDTVASKGSNDSTVAPTAPAPITAPLPSSAVPSTVPSMPASPTAAAGTVISVTYAGGRVSGVQTREAVALGSQVTIRVTSDIAAEVHLHGYDKMVDVPAGGTAEIPFTADIPGSFECELEGLGKLLFQLRVS